MFEMQYSLRPFNKMSELELGTVMSNTATASKGLEKGKGIHTWLWQSINSLSHYRQIHLPVPEHLLPLCKPLKGK